MILLVTDRPGFFAQGRYLERIELSRTAVVRPEVSELLAFLEGERSTTELVLYDYPSPEERSRLLTIHSAFKSLLPIVLLCPDDDAREVMTLAELGFRYFRTVPDLEQPNLNSQLHTIREAYASQRLFGDLRTLYDLALRNQTQRTRQLLDSLHFGVMLLSAPDRHGDCNLQDVNHRLEFILRTDLKSARAGSLQRLHLSPDLSAAARLLIPDRIQSTTASPLRLFTLDDGSCIERMLAPYFSADGEVAGYILVCRDVTFEVEAGIRDRLTGLYTRAHLERNFARKLDWFERYTGIPIVTASLLVVECYDADRTADLPQRAADILQSVVRDLDGLCRSGVGQFVVLLAGADRSQALRIAARIGANLRALPHLTLHIGLASCQVYASEDGRMHAIDAGGQLKRLFREAESALQRAQSLGLEVVHYAPASGYSTLDEHGTITATPPDSGGRGVAQTE